MAVRSLAGLLPSGAAPRPFLRWAASRGFSRSTSLCDDGVPAARGGSLLLQCADSLGVVSAVSETLHGCGWNVTSADVHVERHGGPGPPSPRDTLLCRFSFEDVGATLRPLAEIEDRLGRSVAGSFRACRSSLLFDTGRHVTFRAPDSEESDGAQTVPVCEVVRPSGKCRAGIFLSKREHCLNHLLDRSRWGDLKIDIPYVVSNAERGPDHPVRRALEDAGIEYIYIKMDGRERSEWETDLRAAVSTAPDVDVLILARFMRILSPSFLSWRPPHSIVNIHHGLLPSFKGANPYRQAYDAGVKLIGATAHFVTEDLDEGPILEQTVDVTTHRDTVRDVRIKSEALECAALERAVRCVTENRVAVIGQRTVVFR